jgi:hypothetical protein
MSQLKILSQQEIKEFDTPPMFSAEGRNCFFIIPEHAINVINSLRSPTNQVGFILQLGYFKAVNKFFSPSQFLFTDLKYVQKKLRISDTDIALGYYNESTYKRHREIILKELGYRKFDSNKLFLRKEAACLCQKLVSPRAVFNELNNFLKWKRIEIPKFNTFAQIITEALRSFEQSLIINLNEFLNEKTREALDQILEKTEESGNKEVFKLKRYRLTGLKKNSQSTRPFGIKENIRDLQFLEELFYKAKSLKNKLCLSDRFIEYYAQVVIKSQSQQTEQRKESKYLYLLAFVNYQYCQLNDILIEQTIQSVQTVLNSSVRENRESFYAGREKRSRNIADNSEKADKYLIDIKKARNILVMESLSDRKKVEELKMLFSSEAVNEAAKLQSELKKITKEALDITKNIDMDDILENRSLKLQNRASSVIKNVKFDDSASDKSLIDAINYFRQKDGKLTDKAPMEFLNTDERNKQFDCNGKFRLSLYKSMLFKKVAEGVKSGALSLKYSNKYRSFSDYLIPLDRWNKDKGAILSRTGLEKASEFNKVIKTLEGILGEQFKRTNDNISSNKNKQVVVESSGNLKVVTPRQKEPGECETGLKGLFPQNRLISAYEVLAAVNKVAGFTDSFEHWQMKYNRNKPADKTFFAGIIGCGCNLGTKKLVKISHRVNSAELEKTVNWYFTNENLIDANDKILELMDKLELPKEYRKNLKLVHTSSDGQKYNTGVESLNANFSFKYFGKNQGISFTGLLMQVTDCFIQQ